jgi:formylmethanofuran dehydrogenase subunit E
MNKKDPNYVAALEKAIKEKWGELATMNPKFFWNPDKEQEYLASTKEALKKDASNEQTREKQDLGGILIPKKLISRNNKSCSICKEYSFDKKDDVYLNKFTTCYKCYIQHIEGREERWMSGWRPNGDK